MANEYLSFFVWYECMNLHIFDELQSLHIWPTSSLSTCPCSPPQLFWAPLCCLVWQMLRGHRVHFCSVLGPTSSPGDAGSLYCCCLIMTSGPFQWLQPGSTFFFFKVTYFMGLYWCFYVRLQVYPRPHLISPSPFKDTKNRGSPR